MMREILERFRYRFELWRREQREDLLDSQPRDTSHYHDPRNTTIITESTSRFAVRVAVVFLGGIAILSVIDCLVAMVWPAARHTADIIVLIFVGIWTIGTAATVLDMRKARRMQKDEARKEI